MKNLCILLITLFAANITNAQISEWVKEAGGTNPDEAYNICTDASGNSYVLGTFGNATIAFGSYSLTNNGIYNIFIVKYDINGNVVWAKSAGGTNSDVGYGISTDANNNIYITGGFSSSSITFGSTTLTNSGGNNNFFIAKYNSLGNVVWAKGAGGSGNIKDFGSDIKTDANGNSYVCGWTVYRTISFDGLPLIANGINSYPSIFLVKYDANGNALWVKGAKGMSNNNSATKIALDNNSNVFVSGNFVTDTIKFENISLVNRGSYGVEDFFIAKYNASGNLIWAKSAGGTGIDLSNGINTDNIGNVYLTGGFMSNTITFGSNTFTNAGSTDFFIVKYDANGNLIWAKNAGGSSSENGYGIGVDNNGYIYVCGMFFSSTITFGTTTLIFNGSYKTGVIFIVKYDANGNVLWAENTGGTGTANGNVNISKNVVNNIFLAGTFYSSANFNTIDINSAGSSDIFVAKLCANPPTIPTITKNGDSLVSSNANYYQWYYYNNIVTGATSQKYKPSNIGVYSVIITDANGCSATSSPYSFTTNIKENSFNNYIKIIPNPFMSFTTIEFNFTSNDNIQLNIYNIYGQNIKTSYNFSENKILLNRDNLSNGIYFLQLLKDNKTIATEKIVVE